MLPGMMSGAAACTKQLPTLATVIYHTVHQAVMRGAGLGLTNLAGGAFSAYPTVGGFSRSAVNADSGAVSREQQQHAACSICQV